RAVGGGDGPDDADRARLPGRAGAAGDGGGTRQERSWRDGRQGRGRLRPAVVLGPDVGGREAPARDALSPPQAAFEVPPANCEAGESSLISPFGESAPGRGFWLGTPLDLGRVVDLSREVEPLARPRVRGLRLGRSAVPRERPDCDALGASVAVGRAPDARTS